MVTASDIENAARDLTALLGADKVLTDDFVRASYTRDNTTIYSPLSRPGMVVLPQTTEDVARIVRVANQYRLPVTPSGGRANTWAGIDSCGGIAVDMNNMNRIIEIDEANLTLTAQAGAALYILDRELRKRGLHYPTHPLHTGPMSLGAEVAKCTGGTAGGMGGHVTHRVVGMEVVLGNGEA